MPSITPSPQVFVFDAYGTLFDVHSLTEALEAQFPGKGALVSQAWRTKQLEYTWQRTLMSRYADFAQVTEEALRYATALHHCEYSQTTLDELMHAYGQLSLFDDARTALTSLRARGTPIGVLSNGSPDMLASVVAHNGLEAAFDAVLSVDALRVYKPARAVYQLAVDRFGVPANEICFVSANGWDASGAKSFGFQVYWVNRSRLPAETTGLVADRELTDLSGLIG